MTITPTLHLSKVAGIVSVHKCLQRHGKVKPLPVHTSGRNSTKGCATLNKELLKSVSQNSMKLILLVFIHTCVHYIYADVYLLGLCLPCSICIGTLLVRSSFGGVVEIGVGGRDWA